MVINGGSVSQAQCIRMLYYFRYIIVQLQKLDKQVIQTKATISSSFTTDGAYVAKHPAFFGCDYRLIGVQRLCFPNIQTGVKPLPGQKIDIMPLAMPLVCNL